MRRPPPSFAQKFYISLRLASLALLKAFAMGEYQRRTKR